MEAIMPNQSSIHPFLNWTKQRIDEMDATLAALEAQAAKSTAEAKEKVNQTIANLKKRREEFQTKAKAQTKAGEAAVKTGKAQLEMQWQGFEAQVKTYFDTAGKQVEQQRAIFQNVAAAQAKAWREAAEKFQSEAAKVATARRADLDTAVKQMKADSAEAEARLQKLRQAGSETWSALSAALAESRKAFDRANEKAGDALKRSVKPDAA
jgi:hypothetical protein